MGIQRFRENKWFTKVPRAGSVVEPGFKPWKPMLLVALRWDPATMLDIGVTTPGTQHLPGARHSSKHFAYTNSPNPHNGLMPFHNWGNWGTERLNNLPKVTELVCIGGVFISTNDHLELGFSFKIKYGNTIFLHLSVEYWHRNFSNTKSSTFQNFLQY